MAAREGLEAESQSAWSIVARGPALGEPSRGTREASGRAAPATSAGATSVAAASAQEGCQTRAAQLAPVVGDGHTREHEAARQPRNRAPEAFVVLGGQTFSFLPHPNPGEVAVRTQDLIALLGVLAAGSYVISALARAAVLWRTRTAAARDTGAFEERLARLERAVEGLAVDTQRVTDGQRFLTQLLADRASASAPASGVPARVVRE